jgi:CSLREA domain-containing protein/uncharacterized repeat protein (TIGR01451 family)
MRFLSLTVLISILLAGTVYAAPKHAPKTDPIEAVEEISLHATGRGNPWLNLSDGGPLPTRYPASSTLKQAIVTNQARPLSLATDDFDEDGVPDLVVGYDTPPSLVVHWGNLDAVYPDGPEAQRRKAAGTFTDSPFLPTAAVYELKTAPDFIGAGDFDNDGHRDVVMAERGATSLTLMAGDGEGGLAAAEMIDLPGTVTALAVGEIGRPDGLVDVAVAVEMRDRSASGEAAVMVFQGAAGALHSDPDLVAAPKPVTDVVLAKIGEGSAVDVVCALGRELLVLHREDKGGAQAQPVERVPLAFEAIALTVGNFAPSDSVEPAERLRPQLALLAGDGTIHVADTVSFDEVAQRAVGGLDSAEVNRTRLVRARVSSHGMDDLLVIDGEHRSVHVLQSLSLVPDGAVSVTLDSDRAPVAVLPMRLNADGLDDLIVLQAGATAPVAARTAPVNTYTVDSTAQEVDVDPDDGLCRDGLGRCTFHAAIQQANASTGADEIRFDLGTGIPTLAWRMDYPDITEALTIRGDTGGATRVSLGDARLRVVAPNTTLRGLQSRQGIFMTWTYGDQGQFMPADNNIIEGCHLGPWDEPQFGLITVAGTAGHQIGGTTAQARNVIVGNTGGASADAGIYINGCAHNQCRIEGNYIGLEADGITPHGNGGFGIELVMNFGYDDILIGGTTEQARNVIAATEMTSLGHGGSGIRATGDPDYRDTLSVLIHGNYIGTDALGNLGTGNASHGIALADDVWNVAVGGTAVGAGNLIAGNAGDGVKLENTIRDAIRGNSIYANGGIGIDLDGDGPSPNDDRDWDVGANTLQNWPEISGLTFENNEMEVTFRVDAAPAGGAHSYPMQIDFYVGDHAGDGAGGKTYIGSVEYAESEAETWVTKSFVPRVTPTVLGLVVATATDANGNTSEFSAHYAGTDIVVDTTGDEPDVDPGDGVCAIAGGGCTLRAALQTANAGTGGDVVTFNIPGSDTPGIYVRSALPTVSEPVCIDGTTQPGSGRVVINGEEVPVGNDGLALTGGDSTLRGLAIAGFPGDNVVLQTGDDNVIEGCYIGTVWGAIERVGLSATGIHITGGSARNVIGGVASAMANVVAGSFGSGILVEGETSINNRVLGSYIGTDAVGSSGLGNAEFGVHILGSSGNLLQGNVIARNGASGGRSGVLISGDTATDNTVRDNFIGTSAGGAACLSNAGPGVSIEHASQNHVVENTISCNGGAGLYIKKGAGNTAFGNHIGTNAAGDVALGNDDAGVYILDGHDNIIGAQSDPSDLRSGNLISGNGGPGVSISGQAATGNKVFGNYIGTDITGEAALGNLLAGVSVSEASGNWIGTAGSQRAGNLISGNVGDGIRIDGKSATGNRVRDNVVGLNASSDAKLPNTDAGIDLFEAQNTLIVGNVIGGNQETGIELTWANENQVYQNYVGTNAASAKDLGNGKHGILLNTSSGNEIGGPGGRGNVVGNNGRHGIGTDSGYSRQNSVVHNWIGVAPGGTSIPNRVYGVQHSNAQTTICANKIWYNGGKADHYGLYDSGDSIICANSIHHNQGSGLKASGARVQANSIQHNSGKGGIQTTNPWTLILENNIVDNAGDGLYSGTEPRIVDAENNWWGDVNGPGGEGPGDGDEVSTGVDYEPWLTQPVDVAIVPRTDPVYAPGGGTNSRSQTNQAVSAANLIFFQNWATADDVLTITVSDTQGWLMPPATFTVTLEDVLGASVPVSVTIPAGAPVGTVDDVTVTAVSQADPADSDTESFQVIAVLTADLSVAVDDPGLATAAPYQYAVVVSNNGPNTATNVVLTDTLPVTATLSSAQASQGSCAPAVHDADVIVCALGDLASGAQAEVVLTAALTSTVDTAVLNIVEVAGSEHDDDLVNNVDIAYTEVGAMIYLPLAMRN